MHLIHVSDTASKEILRGQVYNIGHIQWRMAFVTIAMISVGNNQFPSRGTSSWPLTQSLVTDL